MVSSTVAVAMLVCVGVGFVAGLVACWTGGMFEIARQADGNTDYDTLPGPDDWGFPPAPGVYDQETDTAEEAV